jgi:RHS repeat-associated protein
VRIPFRFLCCLLTLLALAAGNTHAQAPATQGFTPNKFGFTGHEYDAETGLIYFKSRYYDPEIGRFISADPYEGDSKTPISWNAYLYAHGNPLTFIDKDGHAAIDAIEGFASAAINTLFAQTRLDVFDEHRAKRSGAIPANAPAGSYGSRFKVDFRNGGVTKEYVPAPSMGEQVKETLLLGMPALGQAIGQTAGAIDVRLREDSSKAQRDAADADLGGAAFAVTAAVATRQGGQALKQHYAPPRSLTLDSPSPSANLGHPDAVIIGEGPGLGVVLRRDTVPASVVAKPNSPIGNEPGKLYHYTSSKHADGILENGLQPGMSGKVYTTPDGTKSGLQAQIDLALPPNRGIPNALFEIDAKSLSRSGVKVPDATTVRRDFNMPGGGQEVVLDNLVPPEAIKRIR